MVLPEALQSRIARLNRRLDKFAKSLMLDDEEDEDKAEKKFLKIFSDVCALVREESARQNLHLPELAAAAQKIISKGILYGYGEGAVFSSMPSWAHDADAGQPLVEDTNGAKLRFRKTTSDAWKDNMKKHPKSSPFARPRPNIPTLTPTVANPMAMSVYDARCEITSEQISSPTKLCLSQGNLCLALSAASEWQNRSPAFYYYLLDQIDETTGFPNQHFEEPELASVALHIALDESRRLILMAKKYKDGALPTHTLDCSRANGPIAVLPNGTIVRAGSGRFAVWDIDSLETHGEDGEGVIGEESKDILKNTMRDDPEDIEVWSSSPNTSIIQFAGQPNLCVAGWVSLVQAPSTMICHSDNYDCDTVDLEHNGSLVSCYIGHGGTVKDLSVSTTDPQVFLTACGDGFARLFDIRTPLSILTFDACQQNEPCYAAVLAHPDGIPSTGNAE
ncbi:hypothetical protein FRC07_009652 [Ceratobasidium sp. 392]|nr:hypothetical protein FRC07_009652 [Ceratobasidium sp. 392]